MFGRVSRFTPFRLPDRRSDVARLSCECVIVPFNDRDRTSNRDIRTLAELAFRDGIMDRIRLREKRFHERAYLFVLQALEYCQAQLVERRHITGPELAEACRDLALARYGVMARLVLDHWGLRSSSDIGDVVFTLVDLGLLISQPTDTRDDFADVFDFETVFERDYPWNGAPAA